MFFTCNMATMHFFKVEFLAMNKYLQRASLTGAASEKNMLPHTAMRIGMELTYRSENTESDLSCSVEVSLS